MQAKPVILLAALAVGAVALFVGILPVAYGVRVWIGLVVSAALVVGLPYLLGRKVDEGPRERQSFTEAGSQAEPI